MSLGEVSNSREFLAPTTDFDDESCSYNDEDPVEKLHSTMQKNVLQFGFFT